MDDPDRPLDQLAKGFRRRTLKTVRLLAGAGVKAARRSLLGARPAAPKDEAAAVAAAERLVGELDGLKGLVMKFGQMASYLDHTLPPAAQRVLARLQSESRPMAAEVVDQVVRQELGDTPAALFDAFEPTPFAAASIGQVHRARLRGRPVAVKIQYPGIVEALESDLGIVKRFAGIGLLLSPLDGGALAGELRARVLEECDYVREADNQMLFHRLFAADATRSVPVVFADRSSRRVLTSALVDAMRFQEFIAAAPQAACDRAGEIIFETCFGCIFQHCVFNADPHPGNYLFDAAGNVTFLDFGCLKWFSPDMIDHWKAFARCVLDGDRAAFADRMTAAGLVGKTKGFDWDFQWEATRRLYAPFISTEASVYTGAFVQQANDAMIFGNPNKFKLQLPPDWLFVNRLQFGLLSVLARLGSRGHWGRLFRAAVETPTRPLALTTRPEAAREAAGAVGARRHG